MYINTFGTLKQKKHLIISGPFLIIAVSGTQEVDIRDIDAKKINNIKGHFLILAVSGTQEVDIWDIDA